MTTAEKWAWVELLGCNRLEQARVIADLLRHASEDKMSGEDRRVCREMQHALTDLIFHRARQEAYASQE